MVATDVPELFRGIESALPLIGPYEHIARALSHHLIGAVLRTRIVVSNVYTDTRTNLMVAIQAGGGKREIERTVRQFAEETGMRFQKPASRHSEQLVGDVQVIKVKGAPSVVQQKPGFLGLDLLMFNEAYGEINDPIHSHFRAVVCTALDPIGYNEITKKRLHDPVALSYIPEVSIAMMFQPQPIYPEVWYGGLPRRFLWVTAPDLTEDEYAGIRRMSLNSDRRPNLNLDDMTDISRFLRFTRADHVDHRPTDPEPVPVSFDLTSPELLEHILLGWEKLVELSDMSASQRDLTKVLMFDLRDHLIRFACHYCFARYFARLRPEVKGYQRMQVNNDDVDSAMADLRRFVVDMVQFLDRWLHMRSDLARLTHDQRRLVATIVLAGRPMHIDELAKTLGWESQRAELELQILSLVGVTQLADAGKWEVRL